MIAFVLCDSTRGRCRVLGGRHVTARQLGGPNLSVLSVSYVFECDFSSAVVGCRWLVGDEWVGGE